MNIPFTQFLRPDGREVQTAIDRPEEIAKKAQALIEKGYAFHIEELTTGAIHMTISDGEDDVAAEICPNGPAVPEMVDKMITHFEP